MYSKHVFLTWRLLQKLAFLFSANVFFLADAVYIPPAAWVIEASQHLDDQIASMEQKHPDSLLIILGDFKKAHLIYELNLKCTQNIKQIQAMQSSSPSAASLSVCQDCRCGTL